MRLNAVAIFGLLSAVAAGCGADDTSPVVESDTADTTNASDVGDATGTPDVSVADASDGGEPDADGGSPPDTIVTPDGDSVDTEIGTDAEQDDTTDDASDATDGSALPATPTSVAIFAGEGGSAEHAGAGLLFPAGALSSDLVVTVDARIEAVEGLAIAGALYEFGPDGTEFTVPIRVSLPVAAGDAAASTIWWTDRDGVFEPVPTYVDGASVYAFVDHFSSGAVVQCGTLSCSAGTASCADATTLGITTSTCQAGACISATNDVDCSVHFANVADGGCAVDRCEWTTCSLGFSDCDSNSSNGCETVGACPACGDGIIQAAEGCDDGNTIDGDGCSAACLVEACTPGPEVCDGVDNNCNGQVDEGLRSTYFRDSDSDGYGDSAMMVLACSAPTGYVAAAGDCDDTDDRRSPVQAEVCGDGLDNDCDTVVDNGCSLPVCGDGNVDGGAGEQCDDGNNNDGDGCSADCLIETCTPSAEICDGVDNNCDGQVDEGVLTDYFRDSDSDGYGDSANVVAACSAPTGYVSAGGDCDDTDNRRSPVLAEVCGDGLDNDCDSVVDNGCSVPVCGDGNVDAGVGEECDDGNNTDGDGCSSACLNEP